jgi:hypothetical protein
MQWFAAGNQCVLDDTVAQIAPAIVLRHIASRCVDTGGYLPPKPTRRGRSAGCWEGFEQHSIRICWSIPSRCSDICYLKEQRE